MNNINTKRVLLMVVDDQLDDSGSKKGRQIKYQRCLELVEKKLSGKWEFDIRFCKNMGDIAGIEVATGQPKLAIIDMVLESPWTIDSVQKLDQELLKGQWPMILVSARFGSPEAINRVNVLRGNTVDACLPSQFLMWSAIERAVDGYDEGELAFIIDSILSSSQKQDLRFRKGSGDPIDILHITDPHFGKAKWDAGKLITLRIEREKAKLGVADFLAITGDIADQGTPEQYDLALKFFHALANHNVVDNIDQKVPKDRVFLCPGNHDFSRRIALAANIAGDKVFAVEKAIEPANLWVRNYAWLPYKRFETSIAGHQKNWIPTPGYRINSRFKNAGIIFLELNVERYSIDLYQKGVSDEEIRNSLNAAAADISKIRQSHECLIVLTHRHESDLWKELAQTINSVLNGLSSDGPVILMCGHEHSDRISTELDDKALFIRGMPPIEGSILPDLMTPMVNSVRLLRKDGVVSGVEVYPLYQGASDWLVRSEGLKRYEYKKGRWKRN